MGFIAEDRWTLEDALRLIRDVQPGTRKYEYHLCLGGGVLNKGHSKKDLDLYFLPMKREKDADNKGLLKWISSLWGKPERFFEVGVGKYDPTAPVGQRSIRDNRMDGWHVYRHVDVGYEFFTNDQYNELLAQKEAYTDLDPALYSFKGKFMYGDLRIDAFIMGGEALTGDEWFASVPTLEVNADANPNQIIYDPPPLEGGGGDRREARDVPRGGAWGAGVAAVGGAMAGNAAWVNVDAAMRQRVEAANQLVNNNYRVYINDQAAPIMGAAVAEVQQEARVDPAGGLNYEMLQRAINRVIHRPRIE